MQKELLGQLKNKLKQEKIALEEELENIASKDPLIKGNYEAKHPDIGRDEESNADEVEFYEQNRSEEQQLEKDLANIDGALKRIENGTYGNCLNCGKEISDERLKAFPEAKYCIECENKNKNK